MNTVPKVSIIVLNYNGDDCLIPCLRSLDRLEYTNKEIIVVDNGSTDTSLSQAETLFPHCIFLRNENNEGFAKGMNSGMKFAFLHGADWCLLFNYDAEIDPQALSNLILASEKNPRAGLLSPVIYSRGNKFPWFAKGRIDFLRMRAVHVSPSKEECAHGAYASEFLTGCSLLVKKALVEAIGFLDERFFLYYEDADYSVRARQAGFTCLVVPEAWVWHSEKSNKNPKKIYHLVYSGLLFFEKHTPSILRPYQALYGTIRRTKNLLDRIFKKEVSVEEVHLAYKHFFHEH